MSDTPKLEPALTPDEWAWRTSSPDYGEGDIVLSEGSLVVGYDAGACGQVIHDPPTVVIALANAALPEGHPAKITREKLDDLNSAVQMATRDGVYTKEYAGEFAFIDALRSYLPPDTP